MRRRTESAAGAIMKGAPLVSLLLVVPALAQAQQLICIDPGHGGTDPGGVGTGMQEKHVVLDTASRFRDLLEADTADPAGGGSWTVIMTRGDDTFVGLSARAAYANDRGADRFMSIHSNAFSDPSANGTETFSYDEGSTSAALRNLVQEEMIAAWGLRNRGNKTANFAVLRETSMPAELHELAFITNAVDAARLANPADRQLAAAAHLKAIQRHFGLAAYVPDGDPPLPPLSGDVAGTVVDPDGPVPGATVTLDGADPLLTGADGTFRFEDVAPGLHTIEAQAAGRLPGSADVDVLAGQTANLEVSLDLADDTNPDPPDPSDPMGGGDMAGGCGCRAGSRSGPSGAGALLLVLGGWLLRRARVRRDRVRV